MVKWCNSFVLVQKANENIRLHLDQTRVNQALSGPTHNDIFPTITNAKYLSFMDLISGYHNLRLDEVIILDHIHMPVWQIKIERTAIQSGPSF